MCLWQEVLSSENRIEKRLLMRLENLLMNKQESKKRIGVVAGGPESLLANLVDYQEKIDFWIGCDRGNLYLIEQRIPIDLAVGDFDSVDPSEFNEIKSYAKEDRKSTRLNSSHVAISYAVYCLKKKTTIK